MTRVVGHFDLDYFYAQVEQIEDPTLRGLPVIVCVYSGRTEDSGVVSTANYAARDLGVKSGIPITVAKNRLKGVEAKFIPMHREKYEAYSERIMLLVRERTDMLEQTGIDEAFFDITSRSGGSFERAKEIGLEIKRQVLQQERLTCSIGLAPNMIVAKLASDYQKPDGLTVVVPEQVKGFMAPMPVDKLYGIGSKSSALMRELGVTTIADLAKADLTLLEGPFGRRLALQLHDAANGTDEQPVVERGEATQLSRIITLKKDSRVVEEILEQLTPAIEDLHKRVIEKRLFFRSISIIGILPNLSVRSRTKTLEKPTAEMSAVRDNGISLLSSLLAETGEIRRVGIKVADLTEASEQSSLADFLR
ncbi:MAG: DNA polymerase IV [Thaumarchaeota archaeon]|nr:DNA polymerase IV [Nitrososphaerota archaeon]